MNTSTFEMVKIEASTTTAFDGALLAWADSTTNATSARRRDLLRDKVRVVTDFFTWADKPVELVSSADVKDWQIDLERRGLAPSTIYGMISRVSSFYNWAMKDPEIAGNIQRNPVELARPKAPKAYQTESTKSLNDDQVRALLRVVKDKADSGDLVGKRDYAMLLFYLLTGMRRAEVAGLRWGDLKLNGDGLVVTVKVKGGDIITKEVIEPMVRNTLLDYLMVSNRLDGITPNSPLWTRHDKAGKPENPLSSHAFVKNLKRYAIKAKIGDVHLHQTRHTFARIAAEGSGSLTETQEALGHANQATTRIYVQRIGVKKDKFSSRVAERLELKCL